MTETVSVNLYFDKFENFNCIFENKSELDNFWFSWTLFGKTYQSDEFSGILGPSSFRDNLQLQFPVHKDILCIPPELLEGFELSVYLCSSNRKILVGNPHIKIFENVVNEKSPIKAAKTILLEFPDDKSIPEDSLPKFQLAVDISKDILHGNILSSVLNESDAYENDFEDDEESSIRSPDQRSQSPNQHSLSHQRTVKFRSPNSSILVKKEELETHSLVPSAKSPPVGRRVQQSSRSDEDRTPRDVVITVQIQSVKGLSRTAQVYYQVLYPHLGTRDVLRCKPKMVSAHMSGDLERKHVQFRTLLSRAQLRRVLSDHPLRVDICNHTLEGDEDLGSVDLNLLAVLTNNEKLTYQSPSSGRLFQSLAEYTKYRDSLQVFEEPFVIRAIQTTDIPFKKTSKARLARFEARGSVTVLVKIEDRGPLTVKTAVPVRKGYSLQGGALYATDVFVDGDSQQIEAVDETKDSTSCISQQEAEAADGDIGLEILKRQLQLEHEQKIAEWERFRSVTEDQWRSALNQKEAEALKQIKDDCLRQQANEVDSLRRAKEECNKQELRMKGEIQKMEATQARMDRDELKRTADHELKMNNLKIYERRARDEAASKVQKKQSELDARDGKIKQLEIDLKESRDRVRDTEKSLDTYIARSKKFPETILREENANLKAQLEVFRAEVERERRHVAEENVKVLRGETRIAELLRKIGYLEAKMADTARLEMDQLRLQFMAREERYMLDGDREELRNIKNEMAALKTQQISGRGGQNVYRPKNYQHKEFQPQTDQQYRNEMDQHDSEQQLRDSLDRDSASSEQKTQSPPRTQTQDQHQHQKARSSTLPTHSTSSYSSAYRFQTSSSLFDDSSSLSTAKQAELKADQDLHRRTLQGRKKMLQVVCSGGTYDPESTTDPLVVQLRQQIDESQRNYLACGGRLEDV